MSSEKLLKLADRFGKKYGQLNPDTFDPAELSEDYEPQGLQDEVLMQHGPKPSVQHLLNILREHGVKGHAFGRGISVLDAGGVKSIIPATLKSVMKYLGY